MNKRKLILAIRRITKLAPVIYFVAMATTLVACYFDNYFLVFLMDFFSSGVFWMFVVFLLSKRERLCKYHTILLAYPFVTALISTFDRHGYVFNKLSDYNMWLLYVVLLIGFGIPAFIFYVKKARGNAKRVRKTKSPFRNARTV